MTSAIRRSVAVQEANVQGKSLMESGFNSNVFQDWVSLLSELSAEVFEEKQEDASNITSKIPNANSSKTKVSSEMSY